MDQIQSSKERFESFYVLGGHLQKVDPTWVPAWEYLSSKTKADLTDESFKLKAGERKLG